MRSRRNETRQRMRSQAECLCHNWSHRLNACATRGAGFSLIEALLALVILTVGVLTVLEGYSLCLKGQRNSEEYTVATLMAHKKLDEIRAGTTPQEAELTGVFTQDKIEEEYAYYNIKGINYVWKAKFTPQDLEGLVQIDLTILWGNVTSPKSAVFTTLHYWPPTQMDSLETSAS